MEKEPKVKIKRNKREILTKIVACFIAGMMLLASFSTFIFYMVANV